MITSPLLGSVDGLVHGLTTRADGSVGPPSLPAARAVRLAAVAALGGDPSRLVTPHQVHGNRVAVVGEADAGAQIPATDGLVTASPRLPLFVQGADCPLLLMAARRPRVLAVVHSGWRGTVGGIGRLAAEFMAGLGAARDEVVAAIFPGIARCCFEVGPEVADAFRETFGTRSAAWTVPAGRGGHVRLDLVAAIVATLCDAGLAAGHVEVVPGCTACDGRLYSHRASGGAPERHGLFAMLGGTPAT